MNPGAPGRALIWTLAVGTALLAWPWLLAWLQRVRPAWLAGTGVVDLDVLRRGLDRPGALRPRTVAAWLSLVTVAALLPAGRGLFAADLDVGVFWLAVLVLPALPWADSRGITLTVGGLSTLALCIAPVALRAASLNLADLAIAQQGGAGNWFLLRDPFILLAAMVFLLTTATLWPSPTGVRSAGGAQVLLDAALRAGLPLVLAHLFVVVFLGGWWAFAPFIDGAALVNTVLKTLAVVVVLLLVRRQTAWIDTAHLGRLLPLASLVCAAGGAIWMTLTGAAW